MTVHSNDREKTGQTKLERATARATKHPETIFNNIGHILDESLLRESYQSAPGNKAIGIDKVTKSKYGEQLDSNIKQLLERIRKGNYRPKAARITTIPKEDGSTRPLAVACFEDKLVQMAVSKILSALYEPIFLPCSYGFRPKKSCHDALRALKDAAYPCWDGSVVEIDIRKYFNSIPHKALMEILRKKISDPRFLALIDKLVTAPVLEQDKTIRCTEGCPQGSIVSPILANIFLHEVIDQWFDTIKQSHIRGKAELVRYADDMVFIFENPSEAERFFEVLPKRLAKYGLEMHMDKSRLIRSGQNVAANAHLRGKRLPTYQFLGFTVYWGKARNGRWWRMKFKSRRDRMTGKLKGLKKYLRSQLTTKHTNKVLKVVAWVTRGWINYHAISDNEHCVRGFLKAARRLIWQWINRRGRRDPLSWDRFNALMVSVQFPTKWKVTSLFSQEIKCCCI